MSVGKEPGAREAPWSAAAHERSVGVHSDCGGAGAVGATTAVPELPGVNELTGPQIAGLACARCGLRLPPRWAAARRLGDVTDSAGHRFVLWVYR